MSERAEKLRRYQRDCERTISQLKNRLLNEEGRLAWIKRRIEEK